MAFISKVLSLIIAAVTACAGFCSRQMWRCPRWRKARCASYPFNVRYGGDGLRSEKSRAPLVIQTLRDAKPDSFGLQEALKDWMEDLTEGLPEYGWVGVGRDDGQEAGEFNPVFTARINMTWSIPAPSGSLKRRSSRPLAGMAAATACAHGRSCEKKLQASPMRM